MSIAVTVKPINSAQLSAALGVAVQTRGGDPGATDPKTVEADVAQSVLDAAIVAHVADPYWGRPAQETGLLSVIARLQAIVDGADSFANQAERDVVLARVALIVARRVQAGRL